VRSVLRYVSLCMLLAFAACGALADDYDDGRALYKAGDYNGAIAKFQSAIQQNPNDAKPWWQLNFAYNKLGRYQEALNAVQKAGQLDPAHGFASDPGKYQETLTRLQGKAGSTAAPTQANPPGPAAANRPTTSGSGRGGITQQLVNGDVYVQPGMNVDVARLQQVARELKPTVVKFAVFNNNANSTQLKREADRIRDYLAAYMNRGQGYLIASSRRAVVVSTTSLNKNEIKDLTGQIAPDMETGNYTRGLERLAKGLVSERAPRATSTTGNSSAIPRVQRGPNWGLIFLGVVAVIIVIWLIARASANAKAMAARRQPLERLKSDVITQMNVLDDNLTLLDPAVASRVREARVSAGTKLDEATRIMRAAKNDRDLGRAQSLLDQALAELARGRGIVDRALAGDPNPAAVPVGAAVGAASTAASATSAATDWSSVPDNEKGVCFFCSKPSRMNELTPVTVNLDGQQQKVLACPDDLRTIKSGQMPNIRAFNKNGRYVPWYASDDYDPYRDYYGRGYGRGYGTGDFMRDMVTLSLIDHMFWGWHHPMGWGWGGGYGGWGGGYAFYPDHHYYHDYYSGHAAAGGDFDRDVDAAGTDFLGSTGGDFDSGSSFDSGGTDFGTDMS
jgi:tetratricopeptide (TPR) repeat protein